MSEWKECTIGDLGKIITGKTPRTAIAENYGGKVPFLSPSDNMEVKYVDVTNKTLTEQGVKEVKNCLLPKDAVCVSCIGSDLGKVLITTQQTVTNQQINSIIVNNDNDVNYIYYLMTIVGNHLNIISKTSTAVPIINKSSFSNYKISVPTLTEQKKIAAILSSLDEKIENNRKINARLEELAQAIFKSWFIDFEPFGGKMPEDWKNVTLSDIGDIIGGATPSKEHSEYYAKVGNGIAWLTPKDLSETNAKFTARGSLDITNLGYQKCSTKLIPCGSILFSSRAPIGYVSIALNEICTNQGFKSFIPKQVGTAFSYYLLKTLTPEIENKSTGSTFKEASGSLMKSLQVFLPDKETLSRFEEICAPIFDKQRDCEIESTRLAELRDSLLPKLMSGELLPE